MPANTSSTTLYRIGADWQVADKTRLYGRYEHSRQFTGAYGLGVGEAASNLAIGMDTQYMQDGTIYSEYRLRDASAGREVQSALGLRNGWRVAEGLRLVTNVERLNTSSGAATAAGIGAEYTASELWKGSGRFEWRQDATNTNYLLTLGVARKLDRNWTLLGRDYLNLIDPKAAGPNRRQNQLQVGFAYRPVDNNQFDALGLYERKSENDPGAGVRTSTDIVSLRANYHPTRVWWVSGRYAAKRVNELLLGTISDSYHAQLFGTRVTYDITNRWSVGVLGTVLVGKGGARQYAVATTSFTGDAEGHVRQLHGHRVIKNVVDGRADGDADDGVALLQLHRNQTRLANAGEIGQFVTAHRARRCCKHGV